MIIKVHRICSNGSVTDCYIRNNDIKDIEISDRDGKTTVIRTRYGLLAVTDAIEDVITQWHNAETCN